MKPRRELKRLERIAQELAAEWRLELGEPFVLSRHSFVAPVGAHAVLKVRSPQDDESEEEAEALQFWDGDGAVRLMRSDRERRAMLIERARPGSDISALPEEEAISIGVSVGLRLWRPARRPFRWIGDQVPRWLAEAERSARSSANLASVGRKLYASIDPERSTLVHGDFHHHNILDASGRYVAIDPKPMLGEPEFDIASFLWNPLGYRMTLEVSERRLAAFEDAGLDQERMRAWTAIRGAYLGADEADAAVIQSLL